MPAANYRYLERANPRRYADGYYGQDSPDTGQSRDPEQEQREIEEQEKQDYLEFPSWMNADNTMARDENAIAMNALPYYFDPTGYGGGGYSTRPMDEKPPRPNYEPPPTAQQPKPKMAPKGKVYAEPAGPPAPTNASGYGLQATDPMLQSPGQYFATTPQPPPPAEEPPPGSNVRYQVDPRTGGAYFTNPQGPGTNPLTSSAGEFMNQPLDPNNPYTQGGSAGQNYITPDMFRKVYEAANQPLDMPQFNLGPQPSGPNYEQLEKFYGPNPKAPLPERPYMTKPKWWQQAAASGLGFGAGWSNAASRTRNPIDIQTMRFDVLHPGYREAETRYQAAMQPYEDVAKLKAQELQSWREMATTQMTVQRLAAFAKAAQMHGGYYGAMAAAALQRALNRAKDGMAGWSPEQRFAYVDKMVPDDVISQHDKWVWALEPDKPFPRPTAASQRPPVQQRGIVVPQGAGLWFPGGPGHESEGKFIMSMPFKPPNPNAGDAAKARKAGQDLQWRKYFDRMTTDQKNDHAKNEKLFQDRKTDPMWTPEAARQARDQAKAAIEEKFHTRVGVATQQRDAGMPAPGDSEEAVGTGAPVNQPAAPKQAAPPRQVAPPKQTAQQWTEQQVRDRAVAHHRDPDEAVRLAKKAGALP